jgi:hypothetical protein
VTIVQLTRQRKDKHRLGDRGVVDQMTHGNVAMRVTS